jgi:hypothetical protein
VLEGTTKDEVKLVAIGYRYSRKTILHFILTENSGKTEAGTPYKMKYTDTYGNVCVRGVERPDVISKFFQTSNIIDTHNQLWQDLLRLETKWRTRSAYFCLATTLIGINVTDCFLLAGHHKVINYSSNYGADGKKISIQRFAGMLCHQLIHSAKSLSATSDTTNQYLAEDEAAPFPCNHYFTIKYGLLLIITRFWLLF